MVDKEELMSVGQLSSEFGIGESTVWKIIRLHKLPRYKLPGTKTHWIRREDFAKATRTALPAQPQATARA